MSVKHAVFHHYDQDAVILAVDIDDIMIAGDSKRGVKRFKDQLGMQYKIKDMGDLNGCLAWKSPGTEANARSPLARVCTSRR